MVAAMTSPTQTTHPTESYEEVKTRLSEACHQAGRSAGAVELVAVSKQQPWGRIVPVLQARHRLFGENRVQEAQTRWTPEVREQYPDLKLHLLGSLQSNKAEAAVTLFDVIESLDRPKLARALAVAMANLGKRPKVYVQVNTGEEPQKGGVLPTDLPDLLKLARDELGLPVVGLMCIPPADEPPVPHFVFLRQLAARHGLTRLSMGMSADFEWAAKVGATSVRVGSGVFGPRT